MKSNWQIFHVPLVLAAVSAAGLSAALLGDGVADAVSWICLGGVAAVGIYYALAQ